MGRLAPATKAATTVGGVTIEAVAGSVVAHRRARVRVAGCFLHISQRAAGVEGGGEERVAQAVRGVCAW